MSFHSIKLKVLEMLQRRLTNEPLLPQEIDTWKTIKTTDKWVCSKKTDKWTFPELPVMSQRCHKDD